MEDSSPADAPAPYAVIVPYEPRFAADFRALNLAWIEQYFVPEAADYAALDDPEQYILRPGGHIICAVKNDDRKLLLGVCALIPLQEGGLELAKMAVAEAAQGLGIGRLVGEAALCAARAAGVDRVWLESNRRLEPAINLYRALGFEELPFEPSQYSRADIQMECRL